MTQEEATSTANEIAQQYLSGEKEWPEDEWILLGAEWDINVFSLDGERGVTLYPVSNGNILTDDPIIIL